MHSHLPEDEHVQQHPLCGGEDGKYEPAANVDGIWIKASQPCTRLVLQIGSGAKLGSPVDAPSSKAFLITGLNRLEAVICREHEPKDVPAKDVPLQNKLIAPTELPRDWNQDKRGVASLTAIHGRRSRPA